MLGLYSESDKNTLRDSLHEWYIDDVQLLKELKTLWTFKKEAPYYACGYHYTIYICKDGKSLDDFSINLNCGTVVHDGKSYQFDNGKLRYLLGKKIGRFHTDRQLADILEAREYMDSIKNLPDLIYAPEEDWMKYEGEFQFTFTYPKGVEKYYPDLEKKINPKLLQYTEDSVLVRITKEIQQKFPDEAFYISSFGGSLTEIYILVTCKKTLEQKFDLYPTPEYFDWEWFHPRIATYWK